MQYSKIMAIDYGDARVGIAFSDYLHITSNPYEVYTQKDMQTTLCYLTELAKKNDVSVIVVGMPYSLDGCENERTDKTKKFGEMLEAMSKTQVVYEDERLTSYEADEILKRNKVPPKDRKKHLDKLSAAIILQAYLNSKN